MNTPYPRPVRVASAVLSLTLGIASFALGSAPVSPMTPYENGSSWIAKDCYAEPDTVRSDSACCDEKCKSLYPGPNNTGAWSDCYTGCQNGVYMIIHGT